MPNGSHTVDSCNNNQSQSGLLYASRIERIHKVTKLVTKTTTVAAAGVVVVVAAAAVVVVAAAAALGGVLAAAASVLIEVKVFTYSYFPQEQSVRHGTRSPPSPVCGNERGQN